MKSLWLSSLLIFFLSCVITSKLSKRKETSDTTTIQNYFSNKGNTFQYKTDVTIYGKFFSGILFIKFTNDTTCRVAFTTPPGAKLFEMQLTPKTSTTFEVIKQMDRAIVIKAIQKNIRMFVMLDNFIGETKKVENSEENKLLVYRKSTPDLIYQFYKAKEGSIIKIEALNKKYILKTGLVAKDFENGIPKDVLIKNYNFKLTLHLIKL